MAEILPIRWLDEISICNVRMGGDAVKTRMVDRVSILNCGISELRSHLKCPNPFVSIDIVNGGDLLLLNVKTQCLIIQFRRMMALDNQTTIPYSLRQMLYDANITFVGPRNISEKSALSCICESTGNEIKLDCNRIVDIGYLTAKILKKPKLLTSTLEESMIEAGLDIKKPVVSTGGMRAGWHSSSVLSEEEVKYAMYEVYSCYQIASKLSEITGAGCIINSSSPRDLYETSTCYVCMGGVIVTTRVVDRVALLSLGVSELRGELKDPTPVVGIDIVNGGDLLLLYVKKQCLLIQFRRMAALDALIEVPDCLMQFLIDKSITFVGPRNISDKSTVSYASAANIPKKLECGRIVDIGYLAAKILMKPKLLTGTLEELTVEAGLDIKRPVISNESMRPNWQSSSVLSDEEVKFAVYEVHSCYQIASKLTDAIGTSVRVQ